MAPPLTLQQQQDEEDRRVRATSAIVAPESASPFTAAIFQLEEADVARQRAIQETRDVPNVVRSSDTRFNLTEGDIQRTLEGSNLRIDKILQNKDRISDFTRFGGLGRATVGLISIFDENFSSVEQDENLVREQVLVERQKNRLIRAGNRRTQEIQQSKEEAVAAQNELIFTRQGMVDIAATARLGIDIEANTRREVIDFASNQSIETLRKFQINSNNIPKTGVGAELKNKPGVIAAAINRKLAVKNQLRIQEVTETQLARRLAIDDFGQSITTPEQLDSLIKSNGPFPPNVGLVDALTLKERFTKAITSTAIMEAAVKSKNAALLVIVQDQFLLDRSSEELEQMQQTARQKGSNNQFTMTTPGGIDIAFSLPRLSKALAARTLLDQKETRIKTEQAIASAGLTGNLLAYQGLVNSLDRANDLDSATPKGENISLEDLAENSTRESMIAVASNRVQETAGTFAQSAAVVILNEVTLAGIEEIEKQHQKIVDNLPEEIQKGALNYIKKGTVDAANAGAIVEANIFDPIALADSDVYAEGGRKAAALAPSIFVDKFTSISSAAESITVTAGKPETNAKLQEVLTKSDFRNLAIANAKILAITIAANQLAAKFGSPSPISQEVPGGELGAPDIDLNPFIKILNSRTGLLRKKYFDADNTFDMSVLLTDLAEGSIALQRKGVLQSDENSADILFDLARVKSNNIINQAGSGLAGAAITRYAMGGKNRMLNSLYDSLDVSSKLVPPSIRIAEQNAAAFDRALARDERRDIAGQIGARGGSAGKDLSQDQIDFLDRTKPSSPIFNSDAPNRGGRFSR